MTRNRDQNKDIADVREFFDLNSILVV